MNSPAEFLNPSDAAKKLGVSAKALRIYEQRGLITPIRTAAGWRAYGPDEMSRAAEIAAWRSLGFSLAQIARVLDEDPQGLEQALAAHQATLEGQLRRVSATVERVRSLRDDLAGGHAPPPGSWRACLAPSKEPVVAFDLPWPWGGERFELRDVRPLNYIIGPLFSGKTSWRSASPKGCRTQPFWAWSAWRKAARRLGRAWTPTRLSDRGSIGRWPGWSRTAQLGRTPSSPFLPVWKPRAGRPGRRHDRAGA